MKQIDKSATVSVWFLVIFFFAGCVEEQLPKLEVAKVYYNRGLAYAKKGQYDNAISAFNNEVVKSPISSYDL